MLMGLRLSSIVLLVGVLFVLYLTILNPTAITTTSSFSSFSIKLITSTTTASSSIRPGDNNNNIRISKLTTVDPTVVLDATVNRLSGVSNLLIESPKDSVGASGMIQKQGGLRGGKKHPITTAETTATATVTTSTSIYLSLWLIPPGGEGTTDININDDYNNSNEDRNTKDGYRTDQHKQKQKHNVYNSAQQIVNELAEHYNGPTFIPHVTIVGGIKVDSEQDVIRLSKKLREGLSSQNNFDFDDITRKRSTSGRTTTTTIECNFNSTILSKPSRWNQALILEMEPSQAFLKLCQISRELLGMEEQQPHQGLGGVVGEVGPHMSLYYGVPPNIPDQSTIDVSRIFGNNNNSVGGPTIHRSFQSHQVMLVKTDPSTVEGVPDWKTIADIDISS